MSQIPSDQARRDATDPIPEKAGKLNLTTLATAIQTAGLKKKLEGKGWDFVCVCVYFLYDRYRKK